MTRAFIGLGSNLGDRLANCGEALRRIEALEGVTLTGVSRAWESEPWGVTEQPAFANAVASVAMSIDAPKLLSALKSIESDMGRETGLRYGPRVIDLDILLVDDEEWDTPELSVPHPRLAEREFVVVPLLELDPDVRTPDGSPIDRASATQGRVVKPLGAIAGFDEITIASAVSKGPDARVEIADESWEPVYERPGYNPVFSRSTALPDSYVDGPSIPGAVPVVEANFAILVLDQLGIPHVWDPFPPEMSSDPYNLSRPFRLLVPASMAERAREAIHEAASAPIEWDDDGL